MRAVDETIKRWRLLFETSVGVDLREAIRDEAGPDLCETGLRSVCWRGFWFGPLSAQTWPKKLAESRSAYLSLREHFLRFIEHPNDLHSSVDPLAEDDQSPWSTLRQDELSREEIWNDVTRCMQDNFFFREPETQQKLLNILFIWSKLNPDTGYRQGMHELLAPLLWVVNQDAIDEAALKPSDRAVDGADLMVEVLKKQYIEHDAFTLFCAIMQTEKGAYELGDGRDSSSIVARSKHLHDDLLGTFDSELALHLQVIGVVPQIYAIRWIRLLFGREFSFQDLLRLWDILFAENLRTDVVDLTCIVILLRMRWKLIDADYSTSITTLTHADLSDNHHDPRALVRDALELDKSQDSETTADLIERHSGRRPKASKSTRTEHTPIRRVRSPQNKAPPAPSPARFTSPQKQIESIFQEVSGGIRSRTGWDVSKAVRGAVGEVKRNVNNLQTSHSRQSSRDIIPAKNDPLAQGLTEDMKRLERRLANLEARNKAMAQMLDAALDELRAGHSSNSGKNTVDEDAFNTALAKIQFVSVYLGDSEIPMASNKSEGESKEADVAQQTAENHNAATSEEMTVSDAPKKSADHTVNKSPQVPADDQVSHPANKNLSPSPTVKSSSSHPTRPSLADSSFSFMLGENRHRSSFVSSVSDLPEQRRDSDPKTKPKEIWDRKDSKDRRPSESKGDGDGFTMNSLRGGLPG